MTDEWLYRDWALHPDGTIFVGALPFFGDNERMVAIDTATGNVKYHVPIPLTTFSWLPSCGDPGWQGTYYGELGPPMVAPNGSAYLEVAFYDTGYYQQGPCEAPLNYVRKDWSVRLLEVRPDGSAVWSDIKRIQFDGLDDDQSLPQAMAVGEVIPDGQGGLLAGYAFGAERYFQDPVRGYVARITNGAPTETSMPFSCNLAQQGDFCWYWGDLGKTMVLGENGVAFGTDGRKLVSYNIESGNVNWTWDAPEGEVEMIAATAGNGLVAKVPAENGEERVVRLDSTGQASYDDWTGIAVEYAWGDMWVRQGSAEIVSAAANLWPWSVWSSPSIEDTRSAIGPVSLRVSKVTEANVDDPVIETRVESGISYWAKKARILLSWDGAIGAVPACALDLPDCVVDPFHSDLRDITEVTNANLAEVLRRFPQTSKGVHILFTGYLQDNADGYTHASVNSIVRPNLILMRREPDDVVPHELGHVFGLPHVGLGISNLMCGPTGVPVWDTIVGFGCSLSWFATGLDEDTQVAVARRSAAALR